jgi:hypothetical protein
LAYNNAGQFLAAWNTAPTDQARDALEQETLSRSPAQDVQFATMLKTKAAVAGVGGSVDQPSYRTSGPGGRG